jgi:hypothetical protein
MTLCIDHPRGAQLATLLPQSFNTIGIHGQKTMPEDAPPQGVKKSSLQHLLFITLTVSIDYQRDANALWTAARATYEDPATRYLFEPADQYEGMLVTSLHAAEGTEHRPVRRAWWPVPAAEPARDTPVPPLR